MARDEYKIDSELALAEYIRDIRKDWHESKYLIASHRSGKVRTLTQNRALHLFCSMCADELNASGFDMKRTLKPEVDIPWNGDSFKESIWKPIQEAVIGKLSTTEADRTEYSEVREVIARHMAQKLGVTLPEWPRKKEAA